MRLRSTSTSYYSQRIEFGSTSSYGSYYGQDRADGGSGYVWATPGALTPGGTYHFGLRTTSDNVTFCTPSDVTVTLPAATSWEPTPVTSISPDPRIVPTPSGTTYNPTTCAEVQTMFAALVPGDELVWPKTLSCTQADFTGGSLKLSAADGARGWYRPTSIDVSTDTITRNSHGLTNGMIVRFSGVNFYSKPPSPIDPGRDYYVVGATTNTFQISETIGGVALDLLTIYLGLDVSTEVAYQSGALPAPIYIRSSHVSSMSPVGVAMTDEDVAQAPSITLTNTDGNVALFDLRTTPSPLVLHGLNVVVQAAATVNTADADGATLAFATTSAQRNLTLMKIRVGQAALYPNKVKLSMAYLDGNDIAVLDSRFENLTQWRPLRVGITASMSSSTVMAITSGDYYLGHKVCSVSASSVTLTGGTATGEVLFVYLNEDCTISALGPTGTTAACSGCTYSTAASPAFPSSGQAYTTWPIGYANLSSGAITYVVVFDVMPMKSATESGSVISWALGQRHLIENNTFIDCPGVTVFSNGEHGDNPGIFQSCANCGIVEPGNVTIRRNRFSYSPTLYAVASGATYRAYRNRHAIECKDCRGLLIEGNIIDGNFRSVNAGAAIGMSPLTISDTSTYISRVTIRDAMVRGNWIRGSAGISFTARYPGTIHTGYISARVRMEHNYMDLDADTYVSGGGGASPNGAFYMSGGPQLVAIEQNTVKSIRGGDGSFLTNGCSPATLRFSRNVLIANDTGANGGALFQSCGTTVGSSPLNVNQTAGALWTTGGIGAGYEFSGNVLVGGHGTDGTTALTSEQVTTLAARHLTATWPSGSTIAARAAAGFLQTDWTRTYSQAAGVDKGLADGYQGLITGNAQAVPASSTSVTAWWHAPDSVGCWVDYSSNGGTTWSSPTQNTTGARRQTSTITGLTSGSVYDVRVRCGGDSRTVRVRTN